MGNGRRSDSSQIMQWMRRFVIDTLIEFQSTPSTHPVVADMAPISRKGICVTLFAFHQKRADPIRVSPDEGFLVSYRRTLLSHPIERSRSGRCLTMGTGVGDIRPWAIDRWGTLKRAGFPTEGDFSITEANPNSGPARAAA